MISLKELKSKAGRFDVDFYIHANPVTVIALVDALERAREALKILSPHSSSCN